MVVYWGSKQTFLQAGTHGSAEGFLCSFPLFPTPGAAFRASAKALQQLHKPQQSARPKALRPRCHSYGKYLQRDAAGTLLPAPKAPGGCGELPPRWAQPPGCPQVMLRGSGCTP